MSSDCPIPGATGFGVPEGTGANRVLILGEALGKNELRDGGLPFRPWAPAGSLLERAIRRLGYSRDSFVIWNAIPTHPPGDKLEKRWLGEAMAWGRTHLVDVVERFKPRVILALGNTATAMATGLSGEGFNIGLVEGYFLPPSGLPPVLGVVPSFHPAFLRRGAIGHFGCLLRDIGLAIEAAKEGRLPSLSAIPSSNYVLHPTSNHAEHFLLRAQAYPRLVVAYDIETPYSKAQTEEEAEEGENTILSIQFSLRPGSGIFLPWRDPYVEIARRILALPNPKIGWNNWRFDDPRLRANDCAINGVNHDLMWAWHHLQPDLPRGLQFAAKFFGWGWPWKHFAHTAPEFYGIVDVDCLQTIVGPLFQALKDAGIWGGYDQHILRMEPILARMSERGMPVHPASYEKVRGELEHQVGHGLDYLQGLVPDPVKPIRHYKRKPDKIGVWKPSIKGLTAYAAFQGHELPRNYKTNKVTFDQLHLKRLYAKTKDPLYGAILEYKDVKTVLDTHIANWRPDILGRVHSTFYYDPATGQFSSRRPNIQNAPRHKVNQRDIFRSLIQAEAGKVLIEFDYKSFHALTLGFEAQDDDYMRLARFDIHSYVTAHLLRLTERDKLLGLSDESLTEALAHIKRDHKSVRDSKAKRAILGYGFGMGWKKLYEMYKEDFENQGEAIKLINLLDDLFPKTKRWRDEIRHRAHEQTYLLSRHGYIRRFWEVLKWQHGAGLVPGGEQSEAAIAFLPANDAFGTIKNAILALERDGWLDHFGFINTVHDSLLFECSRELSDECVATVWPIMEAPNPALDGLACEVSASIGPTWNKMEELKRAAALVQEA